jgi:hypothetical protein
LVRSQGYGGEEAVLGLGWGHGDGGRGARQRAGCSKNGLAGACRRTAALKEKGGEAGDGSEAICCSKKVEERS